MTVSNQSFRIMPGITTNEYKKNDKLNKAVRYLIEPNIVNINPQKFIKVLIEILTFEGYAITNLKTPCIFLIELNQLKKRENFLESIAFLKANKFVKRSKNSVLIYGSTLLCTFLKNSI